MIRVLLLLSAFTARPAAPEDVDATGEILAESRYRFCHEDDYPLIESERGFCAFVTEDGVCPSLVKACKQEPKVVDDPSGSPMETKAAPNSRAPAGKRSGADDRLGVRRVKQPVPDGKDPQDSTSKTPSNSSNDGTPDGTTPGNQDKPTPDSTPQSPTETPKPEPKQNPPPPPPPKPEVSAAASGFARILFFVLLGLFVAYIVRMIVKNLLDDSDAPPEDMPPDDAVPKMQSATSAAVRGAVETDVERLLARARAAAQRGAFAQAIDDLYAALLRRLDGDGIINIQPFRTNGDYLREVRQEKSEIAPDVRAILSDVESVHFGSRSPSAELFSRIHDRVVPLVTKALGVVFFLVAISSITSCRHVAAYDVDDDVELANDEVFRGDASPSGIHAIASLLEPLSVDLRQHRRPFDELPDPGISTLVLLPDFDIDDIGERRLHEWVQRGGHLIFAGGSHFPDWTGALETLETTSNAPVLPATKYEMQFGSIELSLPEGPRLRCLHEDVLLERESVCYAASRSIDEGRVFVFADDRWFMNIALPFGDNAAFLLSFFGGLHRHVHVLSGQTSMGANTPLDSITRSHLWPILLQLYLLLGLAFWWQGRAFGALRDPTVERRRAFADHVRALGLAYARSGASRHVLGIYAGWAIERLRERLPREGRRGLSGLAEALATRTNKSTGEVMSVLVNVVDAQKEAAPMSQRSVVAPTRAPRKDKHQAAADFALFRALDQWLALTSRDRRKTPRSSDKKTKRSS